MSSHDTAADSSRETSGRIAISPWQPTILIAEDSADSREMMQVLLEARGYQVIAAENGISALEMAVTNPPNALLLDLQLPKLDGLSVTKSLRLNPTFKNVPIIIISGHDPNRYRQQAMDAGCDDYFLKPINFDRLQLVLDRMIPREHRRLVKSA
jgi:CheY-like chemotaxis protein